MFPVLQLFVGAKGTMSAQFRENFFQKSGILENCSNLFELMRDKCKTIKAFQKSRKITFIVLPLSSDAVNAPLH